MLFPAIMEIAPIFLTRVTMAEFSLLYLFDVVSLKSDSSMVGSGVRYLLGRINAHVRTLSLSLIT